MVPTGQRTPIPRRFELDLLNGVHTVGADVKGLEVEPGPAARPKVQLAGVVYNVSLEVVTLNRESPLIELEVLLKAGGEGGKGGSQGGGGAWGGGGAAGARPVRMGGGGAEAAL